MTYDTWKLRSDRDEDWFNEPEPIEDGEDEPQEYPESYDGYGVVRLDIPTKTQFQIKSGHVVALLFGALCWAALFDLVLR
jgi:hypothetical protein